MANPTEQTSRARDVKAIREWSSADAFAFGSPIDKRRAIKILLEELAEAVGLLRGAIKHGEHADNCAMDTQTGDDSHILDCDCWLSRVQKIAREAGEA